MKKILLTLLVVFALPAMLRAQQSCCSVPATEQFRSLAMNDEFIYAHPVPPPFSPMLVGSMITFTCSDGKTGAGYLASSAKNTGKMILLFHEYWGLNDYIKSEADRISQELGVPVLAVDLYDGKVASTQEEARTYMQGVTTARATAIINGAIKYAGTSTRIGTIGWCFGGGWSLQAAILANTQCDACVMYYGQPETDQAKLMLLHAPVLGIYGKKDKWLTPKVTADFMKAMKKANKSISLYTYDADHGFANPSNPNHDAKSTASAWKHAATFFKKNLKLKKK